MRRTVNGYVLVTVIWVLAILSVITLGFGHRAIMSDRASAYSLDRVQAMMLARGAVQRGIVLLRNKAWHDFAAAGQHDPATHLGQAWAKPGDLYSGIYTRGSDTSDEDEARYVIEDLEGRWNVNQVDNDVLQNIEAITPPARRRISARRTTGVSRENRPTTFHALEELRFVDGVKDEHWFGSDRFPGIRDVMTTVGDSRININTAPEAVLRSIPGLSRQAVETIVHFRAGGDGEVGTSDDRGFKSLTHLADELDIGGDDLIALERHCKTSSVFFKITGVGTRRAGRVRAQCSAIVEFHGPAARIHAWQEEKVGS